MSDQTFRASIEVQDNGSDELDAYRQALGAVIEANEEAARAFESFSEASGSIGGNLGAVDAAMASLDTSLSDVGSSTGYAADAFQALEASAANVSQEVAALGGATEQASGQVKELSAASADLGSAFSAMDQGAGLAEGGILGLARAAGEGKIGLAALAGATIGAGMAAATEQADIAMLTGTIQRNTDATDAEIASIMRAIDARQQLSFADDQLRASMNTLLPLIQNSDDALTAQAAAMDLARGKTGDLASATNIVTMAYLGMGSRLKRMGIELEEGTSGMEAVRAIQQKFAGAAELYAGQTIGAWDRMGNSFGNLMETLGQGPADGGGGLFNWLDQGIQGLDLFAQDLQNGEDVVAKYVTSVNLLWDEEARAYRQSLATKEADDAWYAEAQAMWAQDGADSVADGSSQIQGTFADISSALWDMVDEFGTTGSEGGNAWGSGVTGGINDNLPTLEEAVQNFLNTMNQTEAAGNVGSNVGSALVSAASSVVQSGLAALNTQVQNFLSSIGDTFGIAVPNVPGFNFGDLLSGAGNALTGGIFGFGAKPSKPVDPYEDQRESNRAISGIGLVNTRGATVLSQNKKEQQSFEDLQKAANDAGDSIDRLATSESNRATKGRSRAGSSGGAAGAAGRAGSGTDAAAKKAQREAEQAAKQAARDQEALQRAQERAGAAMQAVADDRALQAASDQVTAAEQRRTEAMKRADGAVQDASNAVKAYGERAQLAAAQSEQKVYSLSVELRGQQGILEQLEREAANAYAPLEKNIDRAAGALDRLRQKAAAAREGFQDRGDALSDQMSGVDQAQQREFGPQIQQVQALDDALYALAQEEKAALSGMDAQIRARSQALEDEREAIDALARQYESRLKPEREALLALDREERQDDRNATLEEQAQTISNIAARLRNAVAGSREYAQLQKELARAQRDMDQSQQRFNTEDRIEQIEGERDAEVGAAEERLRANEQELKLIQERRDAVAYEFAQRRDVMEQEREAISRQMELRQRQYDQERAAIQERMDTLAREQEFFDRQQRDRETAAQAEVDRANQALIAEQERQAKRQEATKGTITALQDEIEQEQFNEQERARIRADELKKLGEKKTALENAAIAAENASAREVVAAQGVATALKDSIDTRKEQERTYDAIAGYADAFSVSMEDATAALDGMAPSVSSTATALNTELVPALAGMTTATGEELANAKAEWNRVFGTSGEDGDIRKMLFAKDASGFHTYLDAKTRLALGGDGYRGVWVQELNLLFDDIADMFSAEKPSLEQSIDSFGLGIVERTGDAWADPIARSAFAQKIVDGVNAAIDEADRRLGTGTRPIGGAGSTGGVRPIGPSYGGGFSESYGDTYVTVAPVLPNVRDISQLTRPGTLDSLGRSAAISIAKYMRRSGRQG